MDRRALMSAFGRAALALGTASPAWALGAAGPKVYLDYSQQELDDAYSDIKWAPDMGALLGAQAEAGKRVRARMPPTTRSYGPGSVEKLDLFVPPGGRAGRAAMIFIHGGNWRFGSKESVSLLAPPFVAQGCAFIAPEFASIPATDLPGMVDQCRRAILWVYAHAAELGVDPARLYVGGHSAGGHLAAVMLTTDWKTLGAPPDLLRGGLIVSGLCDLEPVVLAAGNRHLKLSTEQRIALSPVHRLQHVRCPVLVAWGSGDSPEFRRQGQLMAQRLQATTVVVPDTNHFEILDTLATAGTPLASAALALMR